MRQRYFYDCSISDLKINMHELNLLLGYGEHSPSQVVLNMINEITDELKDIVHPYCGYVLSEGYAIDKDHLKLADIILNPGKIITKAMSGADYYALFTATIGEDFDIWLKKLKTDDDDIVKVFVADALGSILAEATVTWLMKQLEEEASKSDLKISNNYSPGYCDWPLTEQCQLFTFFPDDISGITLTDSCLMLPVKSVSGIVAVGNNVKKRPYGCNICNMTGCIKNMKKAAKQQEFP